MRGWISRRAVALAIVLAVTAGTLVVGFVIKDRCTTHNWDGHQYRTSCYNDIFALYSFRGLADGHFPYVEGDGRSVEDGGAGDDGDLEYPVGTGLFVGAMARLVDGGQAFFRANALGLALAALIAAGLLAGLTRDPRRALLFALGTPLALYAFHNWDLLAVAIMVGALYAFRERSDAGTGMLLGVGAATKLFPGALFPALFVARWRERRRPPIAMLLAAGAGFVVLNLPVALLNLRGWLYPWRFQSTRFPNFETSWYMIFRHGSGGAAGPESFWWRTYPQLTGWLSAGLFLAGVALLIAAEMRRPVVRPYALAFGSMLIFLLTAKVYSPQFSLWLLPFFALVRTRWYGYVAFVVTDAAVWAGISAWFLAEQYGAGDPGFRFLLVEIGVWVRYAALAWILWMSRRADDNVAERETAGTIPAAPVEYAV